MKNRMRAVKFAVIGAVVIALVIPTSGIGVGSLPSWSHEELSTTWRVLSDTYAGLGADKAPASQCKSFQDSRQLLEAMVVMHEYYTALGDESATLVQLNQFIIGQCGTAPSGGASDNSVVVTVPRPTGTPGGGGGTVQITTDELVLAFLTMNEEQRAEFLERASPTTDFALRTWIAENYQDAELITAAIGVSSGFENSLPPSYEQPPSFEEYFGSPDAPEWSYSFPSIESRYVQPPADMFDFPMTEDEFRLYPQQLR